MRYSRNISLQKQLKGQWNHFEIIDVGVWEKYNCKTESFEASAGSFDAVYPDYTETESNQQASVDLA